VLPLSRNLSGPSGSSVRIFQVQNNRKPFRWQAITVSGLTMTSADLQSGQAPDNHAQKTRSAVVNFSRFLAERRSTPIWCRKATFSTWRAARERKTENTVERNRHRTLNVRLASQDFGKPNDLRKVEVSENHSSPPVRARRTHPPHFVESILDKLTINPIGLS
jgi:hypothetical protein